MQISIYAGSVILDEQEYPAILPKTMTFDSAGADISTPYPFTLKVGEKHLVNTALIVRAPRNTCIQVLPRSGLACKKGIMIPNAPGLIDRDYCGPEDFIKVMLVNNGSEDVTFEAGDRVAQLLFVQYTRADTWNEEKDPNFAGKSSRGGFGSTGVNGKAD